jgi:flagellar biosynthesis protein FlhF
VEITAGLGVNVRPSPANQRAGVRRASPQPAAAAVAKDAPALPMPKAGPQFGPAAPMMRAKGTEAADTASTAGLSRQLQSMQKMLEKLAQASQMRAAEEVPDELFHLYTELIDSEVEEDLSREVIFRLKRNHAAAALSDSQAARSMLTALIESEFRCAAPIVPTPGRRRVVALVGPTGVGKTTTIAKLAANFRLREGTKMGLVTVDTYRIAAVEQLRTYAEIIDLPMKVVTSPREMRRALDELTGMDLVLVDTAGRSPRDELKIQELKGLLAEANVDEVFLVMSLVASVSGLQAIAEKFKSVNTTSMILTKLDEAPAMGSLLSVARKIPLPVSYLTTGQDVPDDIEAANAGRMARLVLGQDQLFQ